MGHYKRVDGYNEWVEDDWEKIARENRYERDRNALKQAEIDALNQKAQLEAKRAQIEAERAQLEAEARERAEEAERKQQEEILEGKTDFFYYHLDCEYPRSDVKRIAANFASIKGNVEIVKKILTKLYDLSNEIYTKFEDRRFVGGKSLYSRKNVTEFVINYYVRHYNMQDIKRAVIQDLENIIAVEEEREARRKAEEARKEEERKAEEARKEAERQAAEELKRKINWFCNEIRKRCSNLEAANIYTEENISRLVRYRNYTTTDKNIDLIMMELRKDEEERLCRERKKERLKKATLIGLLLIITISIVLWHDTFGGLLICPFIVVAYILLRQFNRLFFS